MSRSFECKGCLLAFVFFAVAVSSGVPLWGQGSPSTTATPVPAPTGQAALPDAPSPALKPAASQEKTYGMESQEYSSSSQPQVSTHVFGTKQVTVLENTLLRVRTNQPVSSRHSRDGAPVSCTLSEDVVVGDVLVIPRGATLHGEIVQSKKAGVLSGSPELTLKLVSLDLEGRSYPIYSYQFTAEGTSKTKPTEMKVKGGAVVGAIVGGAFSGSAKGGSTGTGKAVGMATGAGLGAGMGAMASAASPGPVLTLPAESQIDFYLASPISVQPVSASEAARLGRGLHPGSPTLYVRGDGNQ